MTAPMSEPTVAEMEVEGLETTAEERADWLQSMQDTGIRGPGGLWRSAAARLLRDFGRLAANHARRTRERDEALAALSRANARIFVVDSLPPEKVAEHFVRIERTCNLNTNAWLTDNGTIPRLASVIQRARQDGAAGQIARAEASCLRGKIERMAAQHLIEEMSDEECDGGDLEFGYDELIRTAREALATLPIPESKETT